MVLIRNPQNLILIIRLVAKGDGLQTWEAPCTPSNVNMANPNCEKHIDIGKGSIYIYLHTYNHTNCLYLFIYTHKYVRMSTHTHTHLRVKECLSVVILLIHQIAVLQT